MPDSSHFGSLAMKDAAVNPLSLAQKLLDLRGGSQRLSPSASRIADEQGCRSAWLRVHGRRGDAALAQDRLRTLNMRPVLLFQSLANVFFHLTRGSVHSAE